MSSFDCVPNCNGICYYNTNAFFNVTFLDLHDPKYRRISSACFFQESLFCQSHSELQQECTLGISSSAGVRSSRDRTPVMFRRRIVSSAALLHSSRPTTPRQFSPRCDPGCHRPSLFHEPSTFPFFYCAALTVWLK